jgi:CxxC motif-containing protein (DUF1111 family)
MVLDGTLDAIEGPPVTGSNGVDPDGDGIANEMPVSLVDFEEFYLLHYFKPATHVDTNDAARVTEVNNGRTLFTASGCASCHVPSLTINRDRRVADVETNFDSVQGNPFNRLFATASAFPFTIDDPPADPVIKTFANNPAFAQSAAAAPRSFVVNNFFADLKRHDLGPTFWERNFDGTLQKQFMTEPLWGVATTAPYGHDGRTQSLEEVILRHGGEALNARSAFVELSRANKNQLLAFLSSLVLFSPDDISSNLAPANPATANFPQSGHGAIALTVLFNNPADKE